MLAWSEVALFTVVVVLGLNQLVMRVPALYRRGWVFYALLLVELGVGGAILGLGLPGFEDMRPVSLAVGLMFFVHAAQNLGVRRRLLEEALRESDAEDRAAREAEIAAKLADEPR